MDALLPHLDPLFAFLRPHLTPYTQSLPPALSTPLRTLLTPTCYTTLLTNLDPASSPACVSLALSKLIGVSIITLSSIIKLPQLHKLLHSGSSRGLSFTSYALETASFLCTLAYNRRAGNPLSTYGETALIAGQNVAIAVMILYYSGGRTATATATAAVVPVVVAVVVAAAVWALLDEGVVDVEMLGLLQAATIPLSLASKVPQIVEIVRNKSTGQLSALAVFAYLLGSLARVFTTLAEVDDPLILYGFIGAAGLNFVLAAQMVWYWNSGTKLGGGSGGEKASPKKRFTGPSKGKGGTPRKK